MIIYHPAYKQFVWIVPGYWQIKNVLFKSNKNRIERLVLKCFQDEENK